MIRNKSAKIFFMCLFCLAGIIICSLYQSRYSLQVSEYKIKTTALSNLCIVQLSDLHNSTFGENNEKLVRQVEAQSPDLIFLTGDILNSHEKNTEIATDLISDLSEIAPVYFSYGNQEKEFESYYHIDLKPVLETAGATVLDFNYIDITIKGENLRIGGIYAYCLPEKYLETGEADQEECDFLNEFQDTKRYTMLLCHMPVCWLINDGLNEWNINCIFSGHAHGGEVILPGIGGLYAPDQGYLPGRLWGVFDSKDKKSYLVLSRGLGTSDPIPRFHNPPEIIVMNFKRESSYDSMRKERK